jgi:hypothetical protein
MFLLVKEVVSHLFLIRCVSKLQKMQMYIYKRLQASQIVHKHID